MPRIVTFLIAWLLLAIPAFAGMPPNMLNPQVRPANAIAGTPAVDDNLGAGGYPIAGGVCAEWGHQVPCNNHYSIVRASTKYVSASDGLYASVPAGVFGLGSNNGALIEESRTNDALWSRDMTNAVWVATTMTSALNAVGIDGTANSATTLTATGASAMVVQTITLASQADNYSVFLKRVAGSGTISLCLAATACGTSTACTVTSTTTFTRCTVTATVLNPIVGIQIATNGDAVIADFNQMEHGGFATSPILTIASNVSRSADAVSAIGYLAVIYNLSAFTQYVKTSPLEGAWLIAANSRMVASNAAGVSLGMVNNTTVVGAYNNPTVLTATVGGSGSFLLNTVNTVGSVDGAGFSVVANGGTESTNAGVFPGITSTNIGSDSSTSFFIDGPIARLALWNFRVPSASRIRLSGQ